MPYPTPPGERIAYDLDGTVGIISRHAGEDFSPVVLARAGLRGLNSDKTTGLYITRDYWNIYSTSTSSTIYPLTTTPEVLALIFPTPMRIRGIFVSLLVSASRRSGLPASDFRRMLPLDVDVETSIDTTNGIDGTWTPVITFPYGLAGASTGGWIQATPGAEQSPNPAGTRAWARLNPGDSSGNILWPATDRIHKQNGEEESTGGWRAVAGAATRDVKAIRISPRYWRPYSDWNWPTGDSNGSFWAALAQLHLYGEPDTNATDTRLAFVTADGSAIKDFGLGDIKQGSQHTQTFKIRNLSETQTADAIEISAVASSPEGTPAPHSFVEFSTNGTIYSSTLSLSSIAPESDSATLYVRFTAPASGTLANWAPRILAEVGEWV